MIRFALAAALAVVTQAPGPGASPHLPAPGTAADSALDARTTAVAAQLRCPVCQGVSIQDSPSELAQQMRSVVKEQLAAGKSEDDVRAYFTSKYGEWILLSPKAAGFNLLVYILPAIALIGGGIVIAMVVRRWIAQTPPGDSTTASAAGDDE